jgi:hypothetical protein
MLDWGVLYTLPLFERFPDGLASRLPPEVEVETVPLE